MLLKNKTVWITGASSGIGEELAYECARKGSKLILSSSGQAKLEKVKQQCVSLGAECLIVPFDLGKPEEIDQAVDKVLQLNKTIDVLINNGGVSQRALALEVSIETDRKIMEINFFGTIYLTKKILPEMIKNGGGTIAVTSSLTGKFGFLYRSAYSASKHALHGFFETIRLEYKSKNINVTIVCPGFIRTEISVKALSKGGSIYGQMDENQEKGMPASKCAKQYISAIERNKKEVYIGGKEIKAIYLKRYFPSLFYKKIFSKIPNE